MTDRLFLLQSTEFQQGDTGFGDGISVLDMKRERLKWFHFHHSVSVAYGRCDSRVYEDLLDGLFRGVYL
jgi:hypothetical protein